MQILEAPLTLEQFDSLPESNQPTEVVNGQIIVNPAPGGPHQLVVVELAFIWRQACALDQRVVVSPIDWPLATDPALLVRQPDVAVVRREQASGPRLTEAPLLAAEVLSPGSFERDVVVKRTEYARAGLDHYWVVDPDTPGIVVYERSDGVLVEAQPATGDELLVVERPVSLSLRPSDLTGR